MQLSELPGRTDRHEQIVADEAFSRGAVGPQRLEPVANHQVGRADGRAQASAREHGHAGASPDLGREGGIAARQLTDERWRKDQDARRRRLRTEAKEAGPTPRKQIHGAGADAGPKTGEAKCALLTPARATGGCVRSRKPGECAVDPERGRNMPDPVSPD